MEMDTIKIILLIVLGIIPCHVEVLGCFPLLAAYFTAVYMEDFYRGPFTVFMYLWMVLWLPMASLGKYGILLLVVMVAIVFAERMYQSCRKVYGAAVCGMSSVLISFGGDVFMEMKADNPWVICFEGLMSFALVLLANREIGFFISRSFQWRKETQGTTGEETPYLEYAKALGGLSEVFTRMSHQKEETGIQIQKIQQELGVRLCNHCGQCSVCWSSQQGMPQLVQQIWDSFLKKGTVDEETRREIEAHCSNAGEFITESVAIFEKIHLNIAWYNRLMENREMIAGQLDAMSYAMENCLDREQLCDQREKSTLLKIQYHLKEYGIRGRRFHYYERENGTRRITMELWAKWGNCIPVREALAVLDRCCETEMVSAEENRTFIGKEKNIFTFVSKPLLGCKHGVARLIQEGQEISGDNFSVFPRKDGKVMLALSDGMGSGYQANRESETVIELMEQFVEAGFSVEIALRLMNAAMVFGGEEERYSTLDVCLLDTYTGVAEFYKVGGHVSYIKHGQSVEVVADETLPVGAALELDTTPWRNHVESGDFLVMVTDGVLEYLHVFHPVETIRDIISCVDSQDPEQFAMRILERVLLYTGGRIMDDMTVLVVSTRER